MRAPSPLRFFQFEFQGFFVRSRSSQVWKAVCAVQPESSLVCIRRRYMSMAASPLRFPDKWQHVFGKHDTDRCYLAATGHVLCPLFSFQLHSVNDHPYEATQLPPMLVHPTGAISQKQGDLLWCQNIVSKFCVNGEMFHLGSLLFQVFMERTVIIERTKKEQCASR